MNHSVIVIVIFYVMLFRMKYTLQLNYRKVSYNNTQIIDNFDEFDKWLAIYPIKLCMESLAEEATES